MQRGARGPTKPPEIAERVQPVSSPAASKVQGFEEQIQRASPGRHQMTRVLPD